MLEKLSKKKISPKLVVDKLKDNSSSKIHLKVIDSAMVDKLTNVKSSVLWKDMGELEVDKGNKQKFSRKINKYFNLLIEFLNDLEHGKSNFSFE